jgi:CHAD domain-containing protein
LTPERQTAIVILNPAQGKSMAKAWKVPNLDPNDRLNAALKKILSARWREMWSYEKGVAAGTRIKPLHSMRVSGRRVQAFFKVFADVFPEKKFNRNYKSLKVLLDALGRVRQEDVFIAKLTKEAQAIPPAERKSVNLLLARRELIRKEARRNLVQTLKTLNRGGYKREFPKFLRKAL